MHCKQTDTVGCDQGSPSQSNDSSSYRCLDQGYSHGWTEDRLKYDYQYFFPNHSELGPSFDLGERKLTETGSFSYFKEPSKTSVSFCIPPESASTNFFSKGTGYIQEIDNYTPLIQEGITIGNAVPVTQVCNGKRKPEDKRESLPCDSVSSMDELPRRILRFSPSSNYNSSLSMQFNHDQLTSKMEYQSMLTNKQDEEINRKEVTSAGYSLSKRKTTDFLKPVAEPSYGALSDLSYHPSKFFKQESDDNYYGGENTQTRAFQNPQSSYNDNAIAEFYSNKMIWNFPYKTDSPIDGFSVSKMSNSTTSFQPTHNYCTPIVSGNDSHPGSNSTQFPVDRDSDSHLRHYHRPFPSSSPASRRSASIQYKSYSPRRFENSPITTSRTSRYNYDHNFTTSNFHSHTLPPSQHQTFNEGYQVGTNKHTVPYMHGKNQVRHPTNDTNISAPKIKQEKKLKEKPPRKKKMYSDYIGVTFNKTHAKFQACITHYRKQYYLGRFMIAAEAARAYDNAARNLKGNDWKINFKTDQEYEKARKLELEATADKDTTNGLNKGIMSTQYQPVEIIPSAGFTRRPANLYHPSPLYAPDKVLTSTSWSGKGFPVSNAWIDSTPPDVHADLMSVPIMTPHGENIARADYGKKLFTTPLVDSKQQNLTSNSSHGTRAPNSSHLSSHQPKQTEEINSAPTSDIGASIPKRKD